MGNKTPKRIPEPWYFTMVCMSVGFFRMGVARTNYGLTKPDTEGGNGHRVMAEGFEQLTVGKFEKVVCLIVLMRH